MACLALCRRLRRLSCWLSKDCMPIDSRLNPICRSCCRKCGLRSCGLASIVISGLGAIVKSERMVCRMVCNCLIESREGVPPPR